MIKNILNNTLEGLLFLTSLLPLSVLYLLSDFTFFLVYYVIRYRKKVVFENIKGAFPEKSNQEVHSIAKRFFKHFCDNIFESIKLLSIKESALKKRYKITNPEIIDQFLEKNRNVIQYMAHYANWEWNAILPLILKYKVLTFYQTLKNSKFNKLIKQARERFGIVASESEKGFKTMLGYWKQGVNTYTLMVGDQSPHIGRDKHWVNFLNRETAFLTGTDRIAQKFEHAIVFPSIKKVKRGYYLIELVVLQENSKDCPPFRIIDDFARELEQSIQHDPALWLWSHQRWKLNREALGD